VEHVVKFSEVRCIDQDSLPEPCRVGLLAASDDGAQAFIAMTHISDGLLTVFVNEVIQRQPPSPTSISQCAAYVLKTRATFSRLFAQAFERDIASRASMTAVYSSVAAQSLKDGWSRLVGGCSYTPSSPAVLPRCSRSPGFS